MASRKPLVLVAGEEQQLQAADSLGGLTLTSPTINGLVGGTATVFGRVTSTVTQTTTTQTNATGLSFAIGASEVWTAEFYLVTNCNNTGQGSGISFQFTGPASPTSVLGSFFSNGADNATFASSTVTAFSSVTGGGISNSLTNGIARICLTVVNGANAGTVQLQFACPTGSTSAAVNLNSYMIARRIA